VIVVNWLLAACVGLSVRTRGILVTCELRTFQNGTLGVTLSFSRISFRGISQYEPMKPLGHEHTYGTITK